VVFEVRTWLRSQAQASSGSTRRHRNTPAARRFFRKLLKGQKRAPLEWVTDRLKSHSAARRSIMPSVEHNTMRYANNRAEVSHQPSRQREGQLRVFELEAWSVATGT
jgi:putative transposase